MAPSGIVEILTLTLKPGTSKEWWALAVA